MTRSAVAMVLVAAVGLLGEAARTVHLPAEADDRPPACTQTTVRKGRLGAAAGSLHQTLRIRNVSHRTCHIARLPRVAYVNRFDHMLGWPAKPEQPYHVVLGPGRMARFVLQIPDPGNFRPADCLAHSITRIRVRVARDDSPSFLGWDRRECTTRYARSSTRRAA